MTYTDLIASRLQLDGNYGFDPVYMPDFLFDFQQSLVEWAVKKGRAAIFADCGLGKTPMQLVWAENIAQKSNGKVLIVTPLAVCFQTEREASKFGIDAIVSRDGTPSGGGITITNYEQLSKFSPDDFAGMVCDESSAIKNFNSKRRSEVTSFSKGLKYRLLCTATAAPNDFIELGTSSEALGYLGYQDMLTKFFKQDVVKDYLGWGRTTYRFRGHAQEPFWRWVCSWARSIRKPSDMGYKDDRFILPPLNVNERVVENSTPRNGMLFSMPAKTLADQREERRNTLEERCESVANLTNGQPTVIWCHLNAEADRLVEMIPGAQQVSGGMSDDKKEEVLLAFTDGELNTLVTKPKIGCWGLNWQHCSEVRMFPSHSFEQYYQAIRRCWRFGQTSPVNVEVITTEGERGVMDSLRRKSTACDEMFARLVNNMNDELGVTSDVIYNKQEDIPTWLLKNNF